MSSQEAFFAFARERHRIWTERQKGRAAPWTSDPILQQYRFTNVFRELDRTTLWFAKHVRAPLLKSDIRSQILATVVFRWFNRITTGEAIFCQTALHESGARATIATAWDCRIGAKAKNWCDTLRDTIKMYCGDGPYVTGAYIIKTPDGMNKLDGVLWCIEQFMLGELEELTDYIAAGVQRNERVTLEKAWQILCKAQYMGHFMAYEVITDLRWSVLSGAADIMTWANPGPGAMRGLNRVHGRTLNHSQHKDRFIQEMRDLLAASGDPKLWPDLYPDLEMREIEHTLCEFDKYERVRNGEGKPRGRYP